MSLPAPRLRAPARSRRSAPTDDYERALHAYGRSYRDVVRAFRGRFDHPPDVVAHPRDEAEVQAMLDWALSAGAAVIPFGGGTSVVGGVEAAGCEGYAGVVTIDLKALDRVLEVDPVSLAARIQAGATGPGLEGQLGEHGLTLRHFPQSFQFSTLGGWIATRAGGHFATLYTHIDDLVESVRALTPAGVWESRRLPGSGAGVSPDRMLIGSEGMLGLITEAWVRVRRAPGAPRLGAGALRRVRRRGAGRPGAVPVRPVPDQLPPDRRARGRGDRRRRRRRTRCSCSGSSRPSTTSSASMTTALECCGDHGGTWERRGARRPATRSGSWREAFLRAPYLRDMFIAMGVLSETFETAITWDRFPDFHERVMRADREAVREMCGAAR